MALDRGDFEWLDSKFVAIHGRIDTLRSEVLSAQEKCDSRVSTVAAELEMHKATRSDEMRAHLEERHNLAKSLGLIALVSGVAVGAIKALMWLLSVKDTIQW